MECVSLFHCVIRMLLHAHSNKANRQNQTPARWFMFNSLKLRGIAVSPLSGPSTAARGGHASRLANR